jgi:hypothetical protein
MPQRIMLTPHFVVPHSSSCPQLPDATLVLAPDALGALARRTAEMCGNHVESAITSDLSTDLLARLWQLIISTESNSDPAEPHHPPLVMDSSRFPLLVSSLFLESKLSLRMGVSEDKSSDYRRALNVQRLLSTVARCERRGQPFTEETITEELATYESIDGFPVILSAPGIPRKYWSNIARESGQAHITVHSTADKIVEEKVFDILVTHNAVARSGVGYRLPWVPDSAFQALASLERLWSGVSGPQPRKIWKCLNRIAAECSPLLSKEALELLAHSSHITLFSQFPLGLARLPGHTASLCALRPIAYRPALPLTRTMQFEFSPVHSVFIGASPRIIVIECLEVNDPIRKQSDAAWQVIGEFMSIMPGAVFEVVHVTSRRELQHALERAGPASIMILSAHGSYNTSRNTAGIVVGRELVEDLKADVLPPLVFLSACQVSPRGTGSVNIADLLLRRGTQAVIAPLVPIDVRHNATLLARFFVYLHDWSNVHDATEDCCIADTWQHVITSNAVHDILHASRWMTEWAISERVQEEFKLKKSPGRIRLTHLYDDTLAVLRDIAVEHGVQHKFNAVIQTQGFIPESMFYVTIGRPERLIVRSRVMRMMLDERGKKNASHDI